MIDAGCWMLDAGCWIIADFPQITQMDADDPSHSSHPSQIGHG
jgi:hypothetical protein